MPDWIGKPLAFVLSLPGLYIGLVLRAYAQRSGKPNEGGGPLRREHSSPPNHPRLQGVESMAGKKSINPGEAHKLNEGDPLARAVIYRLRRDALMIVSNLNRAVPWAMTRVKRQLVFVQAQLCTAAVADPRISEALKPP